MKAVNLIPRDQRSGAGGVAGRSGGAALIVLALLVGLAALIAMYGGAHRKISSNAGQVAALNAQTSAVEARTGRLTAYASFVSMADQRVQTVSQLVQSRFDWSHSLHELGRVLPAGATLTSLNGTAGSTSESSSSSATAATPASSTPPGSTPVFVLSGCATSQAEVAQTLQRLRLMDGASEVQLQSSTKSSSGASGASGGCPSGYPVFSAQVTFTALPSAPTPSAPSGTPASTSTTQSANTAEPVSAQGTEVPR